MKLLYSVWVDGNEIDALIDTLDEAKEIAQSHIDNGYTNVVIEEVE